MPRPVPLVERAMDVKAAVDVLWTAAVESGDPVQMADAMTLRNLTKAQIVVVRRMAGRAEREADPGLFGPAYASGGVG